PRARGRGGPDGVGRELRGQALRRRPDRRGPRVVRLWTPRRGGVADAAPRRGRADRLPRGRGTRPSPGGGRLRPRVPGAPRRPPRPRGALEAPAPRARAG